MYHRRKLNAGYSPRTTPLHVTRTAPPPLNAGARLDREPFVLGQFAGNGLSLLPIPPANNSAINRACSPIPSAVSLLVPRSVVAALSAVSCRHFVIHHRRLPVVKPNRDNPAPTVGRRVL